jgi:hypothetical protein
LEQAAIEDDAEDDAHENDLREQAEGGAGRIAEGRSRSKQGGGGGERGRADGTYPHAVLVEMQTLG